MLLKLLEGLTRPEVLPVSGRRLVGGLEETAQEAGLPVRVEPSPPFPSLGIGMDSCVIPLRHGGLSLVQTTDFFYPLVEDPYMMGRITCANVLSDLYAMGITECDNMLLLLSVSQSMPEEEREKITPLMIKGFQDAAEEGGTAVTATDITGFGILGHSQNLAKQQRNEVSFVIHNLPIIAKMAAISKASGRFEQAARFCSEIKSSKYGEGHQAWIVGIVEKGDRIAQIIDKPRVIEVLPRGATTTLAPENSSASSELSLWDGTAEVVRTVQRLYTRMEQSLEFILGRNFQRLPA
ncbi:hypothetical protein MJG53_019316 [Ovis ammon polii x Ovis aries]|uniref:Uncharacterized protein n=1 Tax=Ovis ammon polii x Ovis aries TaxID=2918886 RepID=A0ACB9U343_9CETA|nr:hypothetical protein MJG53_019316 [Ovis ammon polii x Ovis aries]